MLVKLTLAHINNGWDKDNYDNFHWERGTKKCSVIVFYKEH
jgi:hypothetical protein